MSDGSDGVLNLRKKSNELRLRRPCCEGAREEERKRIMEWLAIGGQTELLTGIVTITLTEKEFLELKNKGTWHGENFASDVFSDEELILTMRQRNEKLKSGETVGRADRKRVLANLSEDTTGGCSALSPNTRENKQPVAGSNPAPAKRHSPVCALCFRGNPKKWKSKRLSERDQWFTCIFCKERVLGFPYLIEERKEVGDNKK